MATRRQHRAEQLTVKHGVSMQSATRTRLQALAQLRGTSVSHLIEQLCEEFLERHARELDRTLGDTAEPASVAV